MSESKTTYIVTPDFYELIKEAHPEAVKEEFDGTEVIDGIRFIKSEPVYENRAMRRKRVMKKIKTKNLDLYTPN